MSKDTHPTPASRRRHRPRPTPKWLLGADAPNPIAQRRCLMVLSVLSGEKPVTDAVEEAQISRQLYYQLESRALQAMLRALSPGSDEPRGEQATSRLAELEAKVTKLEREKRRAERLLFLTRKTIGVGTMKTSAGRPRRNPRALSSTTSGNGASTTRLMRTSPRKTESPSTPTTTGGGAPSAGSEN